MQKPSAFISWGSSSKTTEEASLSRTYGVPSKLRREAPLQCRAPKPSFGGTDKVVKGENLAFAVTPHDLPPTRTRQPSTPPRQRDLSLDIFWLGRI